MNVAGCLCTGTLGNTGYTDAKPFGVTSGIIMVPILDDDGERNGISLSAANLGTELLNLLNNPDPSKRGYIYQNLRNVTQEGQDPTFEDADNNERSLTQRGVRRVEFDVWDVTYDFFQKTQAACVTFGIYRLDVCGNLAGEEDEENDILYPRLVNKDSFYASYMEPTPTTNPKVHFMFDYSLLTNDGDQAYIPFQEFGSVKPLQLRGMLDVNFQIVSIESDSFMFSASFCYGNAVTKEPWKGAQLTDFTFVDSSGAAVPLTSVTENAQTPGLYDAVLTGSLTPGESVTLDAFRAPAAPGNLLNGYEGKELTFNYDFT